MGKFWPKFVNLEISTKCNLKCIMCAISHDDGTYVHENLHDRIYKNIEGSLQHVRTIALNGHGESLMNPNFLQILEKMKKASVVLTSNALMMTEKVAQALVQQKVDKLIISIHAAEPGLYAEISRNGRLETLIENIRRLNKYKKQCNSKTPELAFQLVGMKRNINQLEKLLDLAKELEVRSLSVIKLLEYELVKDESLDKHPELLKKHLPPAFAYAQKIGVELTAPQDYLDIVSADNKSFSDENYIATPINNKQHARDCLDPWRMAFVSADGNVYPCCMIHDSVGNLNEKTFDEIWFGRIINELRKNILSGNPPKQCLNCINRNMTTLAILKRKFMIKKYKALLSFDLKSLVNQVFFYAKKN